MKKKVLINIYKLVTILVIILILFLYFVITLKREESVEEVYNSKFEENIYEFTRKIDSTIVNSISFSKDDGVITKEKRQDFAVSYIILNFSSFNENIIELYDNFVYTENDTPFFAIGYIDKEIVEHVIFNIFGVKESIEESYKFYDKKSGYIALIPYFMEYTSFEEADLENIEEKEDGTYIVLNKYKRKFNSKINEFNIKYIIGKNNEKYILKSYEIFNSIIY